MNEPLQSGSAMYDSPRAGGRWVVYDSQRRCRCCRELDHLPHAVACPLDEAQQPELGGERD